MNRSLSLAVAAITTLTSIPALAQQEDAYKAGPWHYRSISCVDTTVISVTPRLGNPGQTKFSAQDFLLTGVSVTFKTTLGSDPALPPSQVTVTHYQGSTDNKTMQAEHPGDKVQVCLVGVPPPTDYCDPDNVPRGRIYRVYVYRQKKQYAGGSQHGCGGA
jgi:hypothetical protein